MRPWVNASRLGGSGVTRTRDNLINSQALYLLSYKAINLGTMTRTWDLCVPSAARYQLRHTQIKSRRTNISRSFFRAEKS